MKRWVRVVRRRSRHRENTQLLEPISDSKDIKTDRSSCLLSRRSLPTRFSRPFHIPNPHLHIQNLASLLPHLSLRLHLPRRSPPVRMLDTLVVNILDKVIVDSKHEDDIILFDIEVRDAHLPGQEFLEGFAARLRVEEVVAREKDAVAGGVTGADIAVVANAEFGDGFGLVATEFAAGGVVGFESMKFQ
jgi:hypothetical protein